MILFLPKSSPNAKKSIKQTNLFISAVGIKKRGEFVTQP